MFYDAYQVYDFASKPLRAAAGIALSAAKNLKCATGFEVDPRIAAMLEMTARGGVRHTRPAYDIAPLLVDGGEIKVREELVLSLPFCDLLHFAKDIKTPQPKLLMIAPLSGHFSTMLRHTIETASLDHDVYVTDWKNARDIPPSAGAFDVEDFVAYLIRFIEKIGPGAHVLAVCQPCVQALAAVALMSEDSHIATPRSLTLMAGPIDPRINPTKVNALATTHSMEWFENTVIDTVPMGLGGAGRKVYPGVLQLMGFMSMNMERHIKAHQEIYSHLADRRPDDARSLISFYDEYFSVIDLSAEFYLGTISRVFQQAQMAKGEFTYRGRKVDPGAIRRTALLTVEGERDDICAVGQTAAAHDLCRNLRPHLKKHHLQPAVGHYGTFSGKKWVTQVYPVLRNVILAAN